MSYSVKQEKIKYHVVEKDSDLVVYSSKKEKQVRDICRKLNLGSGFEGRTPMFFALDTQ